MTWIDIGALEDIPRRGARVLRGERGGQQQGEGESAHQSPPYWALAR